MSDFPSWVIDEKDEEIYFLKQKILKLKSLMLLTDKSVSDVKMNELTKKQWIEFTKAFPDEN